MLPTEIRFALAVTVLAASPACGISEDRPAPHLDTLVAASDHIVVATVLRVLPVADKHLANAQLQVVTFIKGKLDTKKLDVIFEPSPMGQPARFEGGEQVLAFLKSPITKAKFADRERDPFAAGHELDQVYNGKYRMPFGHIGMRALSGDDLQELVDRIGDVSPPETLDVKKLGRIGDYVDQNVVITAHYSNDGARSGLLVERLYIPVNFAGICAPNNHVVTITGLLKRGGIFHRLAHATWKYPPGPVKVHHSSEQFQELDIPYEDDPFRNDEPSDARSR